LEKSSISDIPSRSPILWWFACGPRRFCKSWSAALGAVLPGWRSSRYQRSGSIRLVNYIITQNWVAGNDPDPGICVFFGVPDLEKAIAKVKELGGEAGEPTDEPGFGRFSFCKDPQGIRFGLHLLY
jgi:hypothetical protein